MLAYEKCRYVASILTRNYQLVLTWPLMALLGTLQMTSSFPVFCHLVFYLNLVFITFHYKALFFSF